MLRFALPGGLRLHAFLVSMTLLFLTGVLGTRAYKVAKTHSAEIRSLVNHDLKAEAILARMEGVAVQREQAQRKLRITHDPVYSTLVAHFDETLKIMSVTLREILADSYPDLASATRSLNRLTDISRVRDNLNRRREQKLEHAQDAASGLLRMILLALVLTIGTTAWLLVLFYRGLISPLHSLKDATARIRNGELSYRVKSAEGVSDLRELAQSFNLMAERLESLDHAKNEFLATISHEIKNPLAALKEGLTLLVTQGEALSSTARNRGAAACLIASKRLESMINNLLHHSRMETGLMDFDLTLKNLSSALQIAIEEIRPLADRKHMNIKLHAEPEIEAAFNWDGIVHVLENLLLNAIKYGHEETTIEVNATSTERPLKSRGETVPHVEISVVNSGVGIAASELPRIFDRFYRGSNAHHQQGMGLGLHVVRRIVEAHHGDIQALSDEGKTRFQFWIPTRYETEAV